MFRFYVQDVKEDEFLDVAPERRPKNILLARCSHVLTDGGSVICLFQALSDDFDNKCFLGADKSASFLQLAGIRIMGLLAFPYALWKFLTLPIDWNGFSERKIKQGGLIKGPVNHHSTAGVETARIKALSKAKNVTINDVITTCY